MIKMVRISHNSVNFKNLWRHNLSGRLSHVKPKVPI